MWHIHCLRQKNLVCGKCNNHCCSNCMNWSKSDFATMKKPGMHFFCPPYEGKAMKSIKLDHDIEDKCKIYFDPIEKRISDMERKIEKSVSKQQVAALEDKVEKLKQSVENQSLKEELVCLKKQVVQD